MGLFKSISLQRLYAGAVATFLQYPLVLFSAALGTVAAIVRLDMPYEWLQEHTYLEKLMLVGALGLGLFLVLELLACKYRLSFGRRVALWLAGVALLVAYFLLLPHEVGEQQVLRFLLLELALHLVAAFALFVNRREENAFWQFNKALFLRFLTAFLYTTVLFIGLAVAVAALDKLFSLELPDEMYPKLWLCLVGMFNTWFFLEGVPTQVPALEQSHQYPKGLKVFTQFVLLPLVTLYLLILYVYFGKIIVQWAWPEGWVSVLVLCFSIAGVLSLLLIYPIRHEPGNTWMRTFSRWFYRALFPLIVLLLLAIWRRVSEYGITERRYVVLALALWLFGIALYFLLSPRKNIKFIPVTLSLVALFTAYGPFNAFQASAWSQQHRLKELLQESSVLRQGRVQAQHPAVGEEEAQEISAVARYLAEAHDLRDLQPWFSQNLDSLLTPPAGFSWNRWNRAEEQAKLLVDLLGIPYSRYGGENQQALYFSSLPGEAGAFSVRGYDFGMYVSLTSNEKGSNRKEYKLAGRPLVVRLDSAGARLYFQAEAETLSLDLLPVIKQLEQKANPDALDAASMTFVVDGRELKVKLILQELYVDKKAGYRIGNLSGYLFIRLDK